MPSNKPRLLLTGASGYLGRYLAAAARCRADLELVTAGRSGADVACDLEVPGSLERSVAAVGADLVLHAAAWSSISRCERDPALARVTNVEATAALARAGRRLVLVSTDLVFGGDAAPYGPRDPVAPRSEYGRTKAAAERAVLAAGGLVVRLPLLFGRSFDGTRGATDMVRAAIAEGRELVLFVDEFRTPLHVADAAAALLALALDPRRAGIAHLAGPERVSRFELGRRFAAVHGLAVSIVGRSNADPLRPRDVALVPDWPPPPSLDDALARA
jgi:dTDP-4-dehydrorhamnose reductase